MLRATTLFWLWLRKPKWQDYTGLGVEEWLNRRRKARRIKFIKWSMLIVLVVGAVYGLYYTFLDSV
jgi:hypothetical protein